MINFPQLEYTFGKVLNACVKRTFQVEVPCIVHMEWKKQDKNWPRWIVHTMERFMDLKFETNFQLNYAMQRH